MGEYSANARRVRFTTAPARSLISSSDELILRRPRAGRGSHAAFRSGIEIEAGSFAAGEP
jgi:hypothetical protein